MAGEIGKAVKWAVNVANDDSYYYSWGGWGPKCYDCGHFVITAYEQAGVPVKTKGAASTHNMKEIFTQCGFSDVTSSVNLSTGSGLKMGDVLVNTELHAAIVQIDGGTTVEALSSADGIVANKPYRNRPWNCVLRYENIGSAPKKKILLNPGHGQKPSGGRDGGAEGCGFVEADLTRELVKLVEANLNGYADVTVWDYNKDIYTHNPKLNFDSFEYLLSIHFDAGGGNGSMVIRHKSRDRNAFETKLINNVSSAGGFAARADSTQGLQFTSNSPKNTTLFEVCFIDSQSDMDKYQSKKNEVAKAISDAFISSFGLTYGGNGIKYTDFPKYQLSESYIKEIATVITGETSGTDVLACRQEASQMVNLNEVQNGRSNTETELRKTIRKFSENGWYADSSWNKGCTQTAIDAVRHVMIEGKRVLPRYVIEHDYFPNDIPAAKSRSKYAVGDDVVNKSGSHYQFYCFFGTNKDGDIAGYFNKYYEKYKDDIPWTEGAEIEGNTSGEKEYHFADTNEKNPLHPTLFNQKKIVPYDNKIHMYVNEQDIIDYSGDISWQNATRALATTMTFSVAKTNTLYIDIYTPKIGDIIRYYEDKKELFRGMIIDIDYGDIDKNKYTLVDAGWWMNKSIDTYQFTNANSLDCIKKILTDLSIPIDYLSESITSSISGVYVNEPISDVIMDILDKNGGQYNYDFTPDGIRIYRYGELVADPKTKYAKNTKEINSIEWRGKETHSGSIDEVKNSIKIISETDVLTVVKDVDSYNNYGFLQEVLKVDPANVTNIEQYARDRLEVMTRAKETMSFEILEGLGGYTRAGEKIVIGQYEFIIQSTDHTIKKGIRHVKMDLWRWRKVEQQYTETSGNINTV